jgi:type II secretory pathway component GspD/PulD (secretin)
MRSAARYFVFVLLSAALAAITVGCASAQVQPAMPAAAVPEPQPLAAAPPSEMEEGQEPSAPEGGATRELSVSEETQRIMDVFGVEEGAKKETAERFYRSGLNLYRQLRYDEAAHDLRIAARLDPSHEKARKLLYEVLWLLGERKGEIHDVARQLVEERTARIQQAQAEMERIYVEARRLFDDKLFEESIDRFERVLEIIRWFPYFIDKKGYEDAAKFWIGLARIEAEAKKAYMEARRQTIAQEQKEYLQAQDYRYVRAKIVTLMEKAKESVRLQKYSRAEDILAKVLRLDPHNDEATKLLAYATKYRHLQKSLQNVQDKVEEMQNALENVERVAIPYMDLLRFPTADEWEVISQRQIPLLSLIEKEESPAVRKINSKLENQKVTINFSETPFEEAINFLRDITGLNFVVSREAADAVSDAAVTLRLREIRLKNALALILAVDDQLKWTIKHDVIFISTEDAAPPELFLEFYNVSEIVQQVPDYPAPPIALRDTGNPWQQGAGGGGGGIGGGIIDLGDSDSEEAVGTGFDWEKLQELIDRILGDEDSEGEIRYAGGLLIVRKPLESHRKIQKLLSTLRKTVGIMVTIEARFVDIQDNFLESLGVDWRDLPPTINETTGPGGGDVSAGYHYINAQVQNELRGRIDNELSLPLAAGFPFNITEVGGMAVQFNFTQSYQVQAILDAVTKNYKSTELSAPRITVFNTQRSHIMAIYQESYLADIEINTIGIPTLQPVIGILNHGSILEAKPVVTYDKKYVLVEVKPTMATDLTGLTQDRTGRIVMLQGGLTSVNIELPTLALTKIRTTVICPDGGTVILGGLKNMVHYELETTVPLLGSIPIIKNLFRKKGNMNLRRNLVVLLKADITILREKEEQLFGTSSW